MIVSRALLRSVAVVRFRIWLATALAFGALVAGLLRAQVNEEKRRDRSEETETRDASTPKPKKSPTPKPRTAMEEIRREKNIRQNEEKWEIEVGTKRGDA